MAWLYGPMAAGAPVVETAWRVMAPSSCRWCVARIRVAATNGASPPGLGSSPVAAAARSVSAAAAASTWEG